MIVERYRDASYIAQDLNNLHPRFIINTYHQRKSIYFSRSLVTREGNPLLNKTPHPVTALCSQYTQ